ncbi:MAG TPA: capsular biosynthesis protein [Massilia sp.]|nr:capsular biosynthesis protein [Massilia sp.]
MNARLDASQLARYRQGDFTLPAFYQLLQCRRVLMLQGPMGNFFNRVAGWLDEHDIAVRKINFNGGDWLFHRGLDATDYTGTLDDFPDFVEQFLVTHRIDGIVCFGDCRHYHVAAKRVADALGIPFLVFEEGYVRPDYITLECGGVNAQSRLSRSPMFYRALPEVEVTPPKPAYPSFLRGAMSAMFYYAAGRLLTARYPHYRHHKKFSIRYEARTWVRSWVRKHINRRRDKPVFEQLLREHDGKYFAVALQVYNDSQVTSHSPYNDVRDFIREVMASFAAGADSRYHLVFKHHPMDRGQRDYRRLLDKLSAEHGLAGRVHYVHDVHLPTLLRHSRGVVTINSTVGLSTLYHDKPLKLMGRALYDLPGLTYQGALNSFWNDECKVDRGLWRRFRSYLISQTQLNGAFYGRNFHTLLEEANAARARKLSKPLITSPALRDQELFEWDEAQPSM